MEMHELVSAVNALREKQLNGGGLSDEEVKLGIGYIVGIRRLRAGKTSQNELPGMVAQAVAEKLEDLF